MKYFAVCFIVIFLVACAEQKPTTCDEYCDMKTLAVEQDALNQLCEVSEKNLNEYEDNCVNDCSEVLKYMVDKAEQKDAKGCLKCLYDSVEEPSWQNINVAREECYATCNNLGTYQFFFSFFISDPVWDC
jgi:hypothetical protein